ncbi:OmpA family protein, partial [Candidatus Dependentiae bacterium]|nr:OmpA family protein [Candidatus Dependentiae bacterium]
TRKNEEEYKKQIENLSKSNNDLKNQIQKLTDELNSVKSSIDQKSEAKSLSKTDAESKNNSELQKLNDTANQYKKQVEELQAANNNLNKQVEELNATVKSMVNAAGKEAPAAVPVQNEEITANLKQKELEISNLSEINKNLKTELEQIKSKSKEELEKLQTKSKEELEKLAEDNKNIKNELSKLVEQKQVNVKETDKGELQITFSDKVLFSAGQAELKDASKEALNKVIEILNNYPDRRVQVEGHTDNIPFKSNSKYSSNWELSTARAVAVIDYFISKGKISEKRLNVIGWADTKPVADNSTSEGRKLNRRVEILLLNN